MTSLDRPDPASADSRVPMPDGSYAAESHAPEDYFTGVTSYLFSGPLVLGGVGYGIDAWLGVRGFVGAGVLLGLALGLYVIWLRYGGSQTTVPETASDHRSQPPAPHFAGRAPSRGIAGSNHEEKQ